MIEIVEVEPGDARLDDVYPVMHELRTELSREQFDERYVEGYRDGYRLVALFDDGECRAAAGYRIMTNFVHARVLYIDDLITSASLRSRGYGKALTDYLKTVAEKTECDYLSLDSGTQRHDAHRFYFREGYVVTSFHFGKQVND